MKELIEEVSSQHYTTQQCIMKILDATLLQKTIKPAIGTSMTSDIGTLLLVITPAVVGLIKITVHPSILLQNSPNLEKGQSMVQILKS